MGFNLQAGLLVKSRGYKFFIHLLTVCFFLALAASLQAQTIANIRTQLRDGQIEIRYDLTASLDKAEFKVEVFSSYNNFSKPLVQVTGDVGSGVKPGPNKVILWQARSEAAGYKGELQFELAATPVVIAEPITLLSPKGGSVVRRGKTLRITWTGGVVDEPIEVQMVKGSDLHRKVETVSNKGSYDLKVDNGEPYGEYQVRLLSTAGEVFSQPFEVKKKSKLLLKVGLPVAVAAWVYVFLSGGGGGNAVKELPVAPEPN
ncbi:MAG: hypothetical protein FJZ78_11170 [Bacteroidetes bacterium]|nr:hypothetical protein [Bacteroidota bacterium]